MTKTPFTPALPMDRFRFGTALPALAPAARPGFLETLLASAGEREVMRARDGYVTAVELKQAEAACEVAVSKIEGIKEVALRSAYNERETMLEGLEGQMLKTREQSRKDLVGAANKAMTELAIAENDYLVTLRTMVEAGQISPERAQLLAEIYKANTEQGMADCQSMTEMVRTARTDRDSRALSFKR